MTDKIQVPQRADVIASGQWDLSKIYPTDEAFEKDFSRVTKLADKASESKGHLADNPESLLTGLTNIFATYRLLEKMYVYASMKHDQDTTVPKYQTALSQMGALYASISAKLSFLAPEILENDESRIMKMLDTSKDLKLYRHFIEVIFSNKKHVLPADQEEIIAKSGNVLNASSEIFDALTESDMTFPDIKNETGQTVEMSDGVYSVLLESNDSKVRQAAFESLYTSYHQFRNTLANTLLANVRAHNLNADLHHFESAKAAALSDNNIPTAVYDNLIKIVHENLHLLHRYMELRKKVLGLSTMHMYDLYTPLVPTPKQKFTYESGQKLITEALKPLGNEYEMEVQKALNNRYIDVYENAGKRSGAYSGGSYDTYPYMLLNWQDNLNNVYTLIHEMGHSMHSALTRKYQPYVYGDYPIFVAEIASTTNENLLTEYLLNHSDDKELKLFVLNHYLDGFKATVFRQTQFAEFEDYIHQQEQAGNSLNAEAMSEFYLELNKQYYGPAVKSDPQIADEWARIPHFYMNYYVYQYATGFSAATKLSENILSDDAEKTAAYLGFLKSGSTKYPIDTMKEAGVSMDQPEYLRESFKVFEARLNEFEQLLNS